MRIQVVVLAVVLMAAAAAVAAAAPAGIEAQLDDRPRVTFEARVGYDHPLRDMGRTDVLGGNGTGVGYVGFEAVDPAVVLGAGLTARIGDPVSLRMLGEYGLETGVRGQWYCEAFSPCPAVLQIVDGRVHRWSVGADLLFHLPSLLLGLEPTAFAGVAWRTSRLRWDAPIPQVPIPTAWDETELILRPGVGLSRHVGDVSLFLEADAAIGGSGEEGFTFVEGVVPTDGLGSPDTQVDLGVTFGARFRVW